MSEIWWIKITTDMFDNEKIRLIEAMPDADTLLIIWVKLLCQAGKVNANGYVFLSRDIPFSAENLATLFGRPINTIRLALDTFQRLNMLTVDENGVIFLPNWSKYQNVEGMELAREKAKLRQQKHREALKQLPLGNSNVTSRDSNVTVTPLDIELELDKDNKNKIINIYTVWNEQNIKNHRKLTDEIKTAIIKCLKDNSETDIIQCIKNYAEIQKGEQYFFKYAWGLKDFLKRGYSKFEDLEIAKNNYLRDKNGENRQNPQIHKPVTAIPGNKPAGAFDDIS